MCSKKVLLAKASLTDVEFRDFLIDLHHSLCSQFTEVQHTTIEVGWIEMEVCSNGNLPREVAKNLLKESLTSSDGGLNIDGWGKVVQIVD